MTDENQKPDRHKGPWPIMLAFVLSISVIAIAIVVATGGWRVLRTTLDGPLPG
jgi:hypothetical protein